MTNYDRVSVIVGIILAGIVLLLVLEIPSRAFEFQPLGTPLTLRITGTWIVAVLLVGLSCAGTEAIMRVHPAVRRRKVLVTFPTWILPALTTVTLVILLPQSPTLLYWLIGLAVGGGLLSWLILANYQILDRTDAFTTATKTGLRLVVYLLALAFFSFIYRTRLRSLVTATSATLVASLLSLSLLYTERLPTRRLLTLSGMIGLMLGETTWALNYWHANALTVGVLMMLLFYVLIGIVLEYTRRSISWPIIVEFLAVATLGIWVVIRFGPR
jgi:hypothetical protein